MDGVDTGRGSPPLARSTASGRASAARGNWWLIACFGTCASCSWVIDSERLQCSADADCAARGFDGARCERALCRGGAQGGEEVMSEPEAEAAAPAGPDRRGGGPFAPDLPAKASDPSPSEGASTVSYALELELSRRSDLEVEDLELRLCAMADERCSAGVPAPAAPDAAGVLRLELDRAFRGYLEVSAPALVPTLLFLPRAAAKGAEPVLYRLLGEEDFELLLQRGELAQDPELGFAIALVLDAAGQRAAGGQLSLDEGSGPGIAYYYRDGLPTRDAESTDEQGAGGWSQLPVGLLHARAQALETGAALSTAEFWSRARHVSIVPLQAEGPP